MSAIALPPLARLPEGLDGLVHGLLGRWRRRSGSASALRREALACLAACEALRGCAVGDLQARLEQARERLRCDPQQAQGELITIVGGMDGYRPVTSFSQLQANPKAFKAWQLLDPQAKLGIQNLIESNASGKTGENNDMYWDVFKRIHLPPGDPQKIDYYQQSLGL